MLNKDRILKLTKNSAQVLYQTWETLFFMRSDVDTVETSPLKASKKPVMSTHN